MAKPNKSDASSAINGAEGHVSFSGALEERFSQIGKEIGWLVEQVPFGMHTMDLHGNYLSINNQELSWLGYSREEIVGKVPFHAMLATGSRKKYSTYLDLCRYAGMVGNEEIELVAKDNSVAPFSLYAETILDGDGNVQKYRCVLFGLSERKQMEEKLRIAATVFQSMEGMMVTDANMAIVNVNLSYTDITGYLSEEVIGQQPGVLSSGLHDQEFYDQLLADLNQYGFWEGEVWSRRKSGETYLEHLTLTAVKTPDGVVSNYVGTLFRRDRKQGRGRQDRKFGLLRPFDRIA